ncbi:unnamed protein product [Euphydryas editha]|uniref:EGF-like domain-containing protein n=1 Tax=Euphydryas editha TaxID=104508 RepID=A0AAU9UJK7_EUPED|nr:unnamed protein product [Euphydryas editha]
MIRSIEPAFGGDGVLLKLYTPERFLINGKEWNPSEYPSVHLIVNLTAKGIVASQSSGRCGEGSPCEQLCRELHDGTYECGCGPGYVLHVDGYGCLGESH